MPIKLPFGLRNEKLIHISQLTETERGEKCNCICPNCKKPLSAKMGEIRQYHFAHQADSQCNISLALAIGLLQFAKEIIQANNEILLPGWKISQKDFANHELSFLFSDDKYRTEQDPKLSTYTFVSTKDRSSDVLIKIRNHPVIIRIFVSPLLNATTPTEHSRLPMFNLDLSFLSKVDLTSPQTKSIIEEQILHNEKNKTWLNNPKKESKLKEISEQLFEDNKDYINRQKIYDNARKNIDKKKTHYTKR